MSSIHFERAQDVCGRKDCVDQIFHQLHMFLFFPPKRLRAALLPLKKHPIPAPTLGQCRTQQADLLALAEVHQVHQEHLPLMQQLRVLETFSFSPFIENNLRDPSFFETCAQRHFYISIVSTTYFRLFARSDCPAAEYAWITRRWLHTSVRLKAHLFFLYGSDFNKIVLPPK